MFSIRYRDSALKALKKMPRNASEPIQEKIRLLAADPRAPNNNAKALEGREGFRLRVGDWRVIYHLADNPDVLTVSKIAPRGSA